LPAGSKNGFFANPSINFPKIIGSNKEKVWLMAASKKAKKTKPLNGLMYWIRIFILIGGFVFVV
jgi:hypothetical protein